MKRSVFNRTIWDLIKELLVPLLFTAAIFGMVVYGLNQADVSSRDESRRILEEGIQRAVIKSFAVEGSYPPTLQHLEEHFGLRFDRERFSVFYSIFASNMPPDITIIERRR
jgi:hypothetical protein